MRAYLGKPRDSAQRGGAQITVYLAPVFEGRLVAFDVTLAQVRGRWLPWDVIDYAANPYEAASALADDWCQGNVTNLELVDVLSVMQPEEVWELALVFRAELTKRPDGDRSRIPFVFEAGAVEAIGFFDRVDLERWAAVQQPVSTGEPGSGARLLF